jgi:hypothetical protein
VSARTKKTRNRAANVDVVIDENEDQFTEGCGPLHQRQPSATRATEQLDK